MSEIEEFKKAVKEFIDNYENETLTPEGEEHPDNWPYIRDISDSTNTYIHREALVDMTKRFDAYNEDHGNSPLVISRRDPLRDGLLDWRIGDDSSWSLTGDYLRLDKYLEIWQRLDVFGGVLNPYVQDDVNQIPEWIPIIIEGSSTPSPEPVPPESTDCNGEVWQWGGTSTIYEPHHQVTDWNCSIHAFCEVAFKCNDLDLSEGNVTDDAFNKGWISYSGAGHDIFYKLRDKYTPNLDITERNLSDLTWCGLAKLIASKDSAVILHGMYKNTWGHYFREGAVDFDNGTVYDLGSLSDGLMWRGMYEVESWCAQISQPSCIIFKRK